MVDPIAEGCVAAMTAPTVVAHRGYAAVAPENTLPAFAAGIQAGATWIEFDVRTTADGVPVVIHDRSVDRTTDGTGLVSELTLDALQALDAGSWFSPAYAGHRICTLSQVLDGLAGSAPQLLVEIKRPATAEQVKAIVAQIVARGFTSRTVLQSFGDQILRDAAEQAPELRRGILRQGLDPDPVAVAAELGAVCYNPTLDDLRAQPHIVGALRGAGVWVMPWTVNEPCGWSTALDLGVDGIITDRVGELAGWLTARA